MSNNNRNFVNDIPEHAKDPVTSRDESALLHGVKSLGEYYPIAKKHFGNNSIKFTEEVRRQLQALEKKNIATRDSDGFIITGLLDLTKFGLTKEQAEHQNAFLAQERSNGGYADPLREAMLHAVKELGPDHLHEAIDNLGLEEIAKRARKQLDNIPAEVTKRNGLIVIGLLDLKDLGLNAVQAEQRAAQIDGMERNSHAYLTTVVSPRFLVQQGEKSLTKLSDAFDADKFSALNGDSYEAKMTSIYKQLRETNKIDQQKLFGLGFLDAEVTAINNKLLNRKPSNFVAETTPIAQGVPSIANTSDEVGTYTKAAKEKSEGHEGSLLNL